MNASGNGIAYAISPGQAKAARALLGWSQDQLVAASGVPKRTIARLELGDGVPHPRTLAAIRTALEAAGIEFIYGDGTGVKLRSQDLTSAAAI